MVTFLGGVALLIVGYFTYGRYIEKNFQIDENRQTPAEALRMDMILFLCQNGRMG